MKQYRVIALFLLLGLSPIIAQEKSHSWYSGFASKVTCTIPAVVQHIKELIVESAIQIGCELGMRAADIGIHKVMRTDWRGSSVVTIPVELVAGGLGRGLACCVLGKVISPVSCTGTIDAPLCQNIVEQPQLLLVDLVCARLSGEVMEYMVTLLVAHTPFDNLVIRSCARAIAHKYARIIVRYVCEQYYPELLITAEPTSLGNDLTDDHLT